jgi:zinc protease
MPGVSMLPHKKGAFMKRTLTVAATLLTLALIPNSLYAQQVQKSTRIQAKPSSNIPTVDQIISKYVQAIGGEAAHRKLTSRVIRATFVIPDMQNLTGTAETYEKAPDKSLVVLNFPGLGISREGYNGVVGWSQEPQSEVREMTRAELASTKIDSDFYKDIRLRKLFPKLTFKGAEKVGSKTTYKLEGVSKEGYSETMYFDVESGLLVRTDAEEETPEGKSVLEIHYDDYREIDGIRMPFAARHRSPELNILFKVTEVRHNVPIEDAKFEKPIK